MMNWILLPPSGSLAIAREPLDTIPEGSRMATGAELIVANLGKPFPWGQLPTPEKASFYWRNYRMGVGGLFHHRWFLTQDGRLGGAQNVPEVLPGSLRSCLFYDGGRVPEEWGLAENEGFAVVRTTTASDQETFRRVQLHAARHVMADGGSIILSPETEEGINWVGFVGRCQFCPNAQRLSFRQLCAALPDKNLKLSPEWERVE